MGRPNKVKFYDYQLIAYKSVVQDLIFFLFTSCNEAVRMNNIEDFFKHYHNHFYTTLKLLKCPLEDYTYEMYVECILRTTKQKKSIQIRQCLRIFLFFSIASRPYRFRHELRLTAKFELEHINYMQKVFLSHGLTKQDDLTFDYLLRDDNIHDDFYVTMRNILVDFQRLEFI